jgi:class 3 adenylate cyclase
LHGVSKIETFSSRNVATLSTHSLKATNQLLFASALSIIFLNSASRASVFVCSSVTELKDTVFVACEVVKAVNDPARRETAGPRVGIGVNGGTVQSRSVPSFNRNQGRTWGGLVCLLCRCTRYGLISELAASTSLF